MSAIACGLSRIDLGQPRRQRKSQLALDDFAQRLAADRFDQVEHALGRNPIAGDAVLIDFDLQDRLSLDLFGRQVLRSRQPGP